MKTSRTFAQVVMAASLLLLASGCKSTKKPEADQASAAKADSQEVRITPALQERIKVGDPVLQDVTNSFQVAARVEADATRLARIGSPVSGRITKLAVLEGQKVHAGQILATVHSTDLSDTQFAFIKAYSQHQLSQKSAERAKQLVTADVIGSAELQRREAEVLQAAAEVAALRQQLHALGMSDPAIHRLEETRKINSEYQIVSSISGTVLERKITIGQIVQPAEPAFLIADLSNTWLVADIPEQNASSVSLGKEVEAEIPAYPEDKIQGKLSFVSAIVNPETRTVGTRMNLPNPDGRYKPAMLATMKLSDTPEKKLTVPVTAVVREQNQDYLFVQTGPEVFTLRKVELGGEFGEYRVLQNGLRDGEKIVLDGAFHLNNQRKQNALQGGE